MDSFYFICYKSLYNLEMTLKYKIIGFGARTAIPENKELVLLYRNEKEWYVVGKCRFGSITEYNPFEEPERFGWTYTVTDLETCKPFPINRVLRENAGTYWGILLQHSMQVKDQNIIKYIEDSYHQNAGSVLTDLEKLSESTK